MTADWFNVELENIISTPTSQFILNSCFAGWDGNFVTDSDGNQRAGGTGNLCDAIIF